MKCVINREYGTSDRNYSVLSAEDQGYLVVTSEGIMPVIFLDYSMALRQPGIRILSRKWYEKNVGRIRIEKDAACA